MSLDTVRSWETGRLRLSADTARRVATVLDGRPEEIEGLCNAVRAEAVLADLLQAGRGPTVRDRPAMAVDPPLRQALLRFFESGRWVTDMAGSPQPLAGARQSLLDVLRLALGDGAVRTIPPALFRCLARAAGTAQESWQDDVRRLLRAAFEAVADPGARREAAIGLAELGCDDLLARYLEATEQDDGDGRADLASLARLSGETDAGPSTVRLLLDLLAGCRQDGRRPDCIAALHLRSLWQVLVQSGPAALEPLGLARDLDAALRDWSSRDDCPAARREARRLQGEFERAAGSIAEAYAAFAPVRRRARTVPRPAGLRAPRWSDADEAEAWAFVGREAQLERMRDLLDARGSRSPLVYVHGPAGVGKSALLRAYRRLAVARGVPAVLVDGGVAEPGRPGFLSAAAAAFGQPGTPPERTLRLVVRHMARGGLLLLVDGYDELMLLDRWLRAELFAAVGSGNVAVLAGRRPPRDVWPADPTWRSRLMDVPLADLPPGDAEDLLHRRGVASPAVRQEAVAIAGGRPLFLVLAAQALAEQRVGGAGGDAAEDGAGGAGPDGTAGETSGRPGGEAPTAALLGLLLHPESPGHRWTFGPDASPPERLLAAASMVRTFDQAVLEAMAGAETVVGGWSRLLDLPVLARSGGCYALHDAARSRAADLIERERPWLARAWRQRAMSYHLDRARRDPQSRASAWPEVAHLARHALWHSWLHPESEAPARVGASSAACGWRTSPS